MILKLIFLLSFLSLNTLAQDLSREQIISVLNQMKEAGIVPASEAPIIESKIIQMTPTQFEKLKGVAKNIAEKNPTMNKEVEPSLEKAAASVDTNSVEFKDATNHIDEILKN
jgi:hypothetical protein